MGRKLLTEVFSVHPLLLFIHFHSAFSNRCSFYLFTATCISLLESTISYPNCASRKSSEKENFLLNCMAKPELTWGCLYVYLSHLVRTFVLHCRDLNVLITGCCFTSPWDEMWYAIYALNYISTIQKFQIPKHTWDHGAVIKNSPRVKMDLFSC